MSKPPHNSSPRPSGSSSPESYQTKRVRNNLAVKKCREAKRKQEKEMLAAVTKQKELNKQLEDFGKICFEMLI
uniref:BZIP domain-containing protein n=1 Tax=Panagrolaimus davidi TaxID=227884 RepID=A0A914PRI0_9BILA